VVMVMVVPLTMAIALASFTSAFADVTWGILGTGAVAHDFATVLQATPGCRVHAVGSRSQSSADRFGEAHGIDICYGSYEALVADPKIDVVYVASPSAHHVEHSELCLRAGRSVLCEKSMATTSEAAAQVLALAAELGLFFMHGVWTVHFPAVRRLIELVHGGLLGTIRYASVEFNQRPSVSGAEALGEGALLETGIYPITLLDAVLGPPDTITAAGQLSEQSGAEKQASLLLSYQGGTTLAHVHCGLTAGTPREAVFVGTEATARLPFPFWCPTQLIIEREEGGQGPATQREVLEFPLPEIPQPAGPFNFVNSEGFSYEIAEANRCILERCAESPALPAHANTRILQLIDQAREQVRGQAKARETLKVNVAASGATQG